MKNGYSVHTIYTPHHGEPRVYPGGRWDEESQNLTWEQARKIANRDQANGYQALITVTETNEPIEQSQWYVEEAYYCTKTNEVVFPNEILTK